MWTVRGTAAPWGELRRKKTSNELQPKIYVHLKGALLKEHYSKLQRIEDAT